MKFLSNLGFLLMIWSFFGCHSDRVVTDPDFEATDVRRPGMEHHVPLSGAAEVSRNTTITIWFDELMDETSVQDNFHVWSSVQIDSIEVIAIDPNNSEILYAAKPGTGIFKSEDGGESWQWITPASMKSDINTVVVSTNNSSLLYAASADSGIYRSIDGGFIWQQVNNGLPGINVLNIAVDPTNDDIVFAVTSSNGIYKTEDGGATWNAKNSGIRITRNPQHIVINPLNTQTLYLATKGDFILKSVDGGESWTRHRTGFFTFNFDVMAIQPLDTSTVFAVSIGGGIYRSTNSGANWELIIEGLTSLNIQSIALHSQDANILFVSTVSGLYKSVDGGDNWFLSGDIPAETVIAMLVIDPMTPNRIFAGTSLGIYGSDDSGSLWLEKSNLPLENLYIGGSFDFEFWQDSTVVIAALNSTTVDTSIIFPYLYERALEAWLAYDKQGEPPADPNPTATKMIFTLNNPLLPNSKYQVRINGSFQGDRETLKESYGAHDISGNSFEVDHNFTFTTGEN